MVGEIPDYMKIHTVVADWYPRIEAISSRGGVVAAEKDRVSFSKSHLSLLDFDSLYFELEQFKRERSWYNMNISKEGILSLLSDSDWYTLYMPKARLQVQNYNDVFLLQQVGLDIVLLE